MSSIKSRLDKLEASGSGPGRCDNCRGWTRVISTDWRTGRPVARGPERCPECGRFIPTVEVEDVEDWRGERGRRPA